MARAIDNVGNVNNSILSRGHAGPVPKTPSRGHATTPVPKAPQAPAPVTQAPAYGGVGGGSNNGALNAIADNQDLLAGDSSYQAQLAALQAALANSNADFTNQQSKYDTSYNDSLKGLGWRQAIQDNPATPQDESAPGSWNFGDTNTAAGRSFQNQQNDFASRGLLQSSLYGTANDNLTRSLNDQLGGINTSRQSFLDDLANQRSAAQLSNQQSINQAKADALARLASGISL